MKSRFKCFWAVLAIAICTGSAWAGPTYGVTTVIDGDYSEWNLINDFYAPMYEAGEPTKELLSNLYLRYDCSTHTLSVLVLAVENVAVDNSEDDAWVKIYDLDNDPQVSGLSSDFEWVYDDDGDLIGYEASFDLAAGFYAEIEAHINVNDGDTSSTGKKKQGYISLTIECPTVPVPSAIFLTGLGTAGLGVLRRRWK